MVIVTIIEISIGSVSKAFNPFEAANLRIRADHVTPAAKT